MHARRTLLVWFGLVLALLAWNGRIVLAAQPAPAHSAATPKVRERLSRNGLLPLMPVPIALVPSRLTARSGVGRASLGHLTFIS